MGTRGRSIIGMDIEELITLLNKAFADEWLAYYQYWVGAKVVSGPMKDALIAELLQHAADELRHADMVAGRILQLGGAPLLEPKEWYEHTNCGYHAPKDFHIKKILEQNILGEQCAIDVYSRLMEITREKDPVTYNLALQILQDEVEHEEDLQALEDDLKQMLEHR